MTQAAEERDGDGRVEVLEDALHQQLAHDQLVGRVELAGGAAFERDDALARDVPQRAKHLPHLPELVAEHERLRVARAPAQRARAFRQRLARLEPACESSRTAATRSFLMDARKSVEDSPAWKAP